MNFGENLDGLSDLIVHKSLISGSFLGPRWWSHPLTEAENPPLTCITNDAKKSVRVVCTQLNEINCYVIALLSL